MSTRDRLPATPGCAFVAPPGLRRRVLLWLPKGWLPGLDSNQRHPD